MIDLEVIQSQINSLQRCVDNLKLAKQQVNHVEHRRGLYDDDYDYQRDLLNANNIVITTQRTLVGQLRLMNYQNEKLLK